ncbi:MAG: hypothetical protein EZS28_015712 [Streblomastix strix]|uniref:FAD/NAD(P)-binding domain-containing protein n=1 Tax=Streblomastix strix TaxID=222440 RepID=A0A5J4W238_9EUKA|nr:MAG: hypothetical protein EZS28_015712 [Streblomastix strix]
MPTSSRPPAPALFVVNSCNYTAATLAGLGLQRYIEEVPGAVLIIDLEKRELIIADGSLVPQDMLIIAAGLQDQTLKRLSHPNAQNDFLVHVVDGTIVMNDEVDAIRLQRFIHKPTQPGGNKQIEDENEICVIYGATLRAYSVLHGLLCIRFHFSRLLFIKPHADFETNQLNYEKKIDAFESLIKWKYKDGDDEIPKVASSKGDLAPFTPFDDHDTQNKLKRKKYLSEARIRNFE